MTLMKYRPSCDSVARHSESTSTLAYDPQHSESTVTLVLPPTPASMMSAASQTGRSRSASESSIYTAIYPTTSIHPPSYGIPTTSSSPSLAMPEPSAPVPMGRRSRASTLRSIFSKTAEPLRPSSVPSTNPYGAGARHGSRSVSSLTISAPLQHTLSASLIPYRRVLARDKRERERDPNTNAFVLLSISLIRVRVPKRWSDTPTSLLHLL